MRSSGNWKRGRSGLVRGALVVVMLLTGFPAVAQSRVVRGGVAQSAPGDEFSTGRKYDPAEGRPESTPMTSGPDGEQCLAPDPSWTLVAQDDDGTCEWSAPYADGPRGHGGAPRSGAPRTGGVTRSGGDQPPLLPGRAGTDMIPGPANGPAVVRQVRGTAIDIYRGTRPYPTPPELQAMYDVLKQPGVGLLGQCAASYASAIESIRRYAGRYYQHDMALGDACSRRFGVPLTPTPVTAPLRVVSGTRDGGPSPRQTICTGVDLANLVFGRYSTGLPISIAKVAGKQAYVVFLAGTEFDIHQKNNAITDGFEASDIGSEYDSAVLHALSVAVPPGSTLIFVGHSLGGMVAQNLSRVFAQEGNFDGKLSISHIITFGSPKTGADVPGITYRRFVIPGDPVPHLTGPANQEAPGVTYVDAGDRRLESFIPIVGTHLMYPKSKALKLFDAYGQLAGHDCINLEGDARSFPAR